MKVVEKVGKTIDEAIEHGLQEFGVLRDEVIIEVLEEPSKGLFGIIGSRPARVRLTLKDNPARRTDRLLKDIFRAMEIPVEMDIQEREQVLQVSLQGPDLGVLIGRRGETLDALQYLVNLAVNKNQEQKRKVILDVEGYRRRREETLQKLAMRLADKAKMRGRSVVLEPMNSQERRIIHTALQGRDDIYTFSEGEEPFRKIIISPKK
ncbi:RNA-binding cell elongation regulator Jag/EloR [Desulforamulus hydrothermalis]|uniref:RNA-binding protein KhpB n=1 Tax=Desulforamulus hydrothermalis Lam5 = DSM 18033 TaxID=1121428 RepID=K8DZD1_9FIRM|nr:RNA-binding cell elongation regulator Jag/EloR [Desulforamulus hydrothermalis]CCO08320.1 Protein jag [Desulforamulus hydrothermalis Lam5 = DSM 18033]SHH47117.1 spoIIIJ-associated protein [Desulforamulus hydrothermalis Lam5 = DSM 18033]